MAKSRHTHRAEIDLSQSRKRLAMAIEAKERAERAVAEAQEEVREAEYALKLQQICDETSRA